MSLDVVRSIAKNTSVMMASQVITWISSFILMLLLPRYLGTEDYGRLYLAISLSLISQSVIEFGGPFLVAKEISRSADKAAMMLSNSLILRFTLWIISTLAIIGISFAFGYSSQVRLLIAILGISKLWEGSGRVISSCFQGFEMMQFPSLGAIVEKIVVAALGVAALLTGFHAILIAIIMAMSTFINFGIQAFYIRRLIPRIPPFDWSEVRYLIKAGVPYFLWSVCAIIYYRIDAVMLSLMAPERVVGWYGAAYRLFDVLMFLPSIYSTALFPVLSKSWGKNDQVLAQTTQKSVDYILLAGIPISIIIFTFSRQIIELLFGLKEYGPSVVLLQIFAVGLLLVYIDFILVSTIIASEKTRQWTIAAFFAMLLNPLLNYFFIPYTEVHMGNGGIGSAIATHITEFAVMCMALYLVPRSIFQHSKVSAQVKGIAAGVLMIAVLFLVSTKNIPFVIQAIIGLFVYIGGLLALKGFPFSDIVILREALLMNRHEKTLASERGVN
ncbi:MAG: flippase [Bacteroidota bacterium]